MEVDQWFDIALTCSSEGVLAAGAAWFAGPVVGITGATTAALGQCLVSEVMTPSMWRELLSMGWFGMLSGFVQNMPSVNMPDMPSVDMPDMPSVDVPDIDVPW